MQNIRVAVLRGGPSEEHDISMLTGAAVLDALDTEQFEPVDVIIARDGSWLWDGREWFPERLLALVDVVFIALHGAYGEDGKVQRILDRYNIPYTGSGAYPSSMAFNKVITKDLLRDHGVRMAPHMLVTSDEQTDTNRVSGVIRDMFGPQYVIKPVASGSSVGTMMVDNPALLPRALQDAFKTYDQVLVEKRIIGKEATCGVLNHFRDEELYTLPPIEIVPPQNAGFFDRTVKYDGTTEEICPGRFSKGEKDAIMRVARLVHDVLGLSQYSRSDFMVAGDLPAAAGYPAQAGGVYFLEVNTLPELRHEGLFNRGLESVGGNLASCIRHLIESRL